VEERKSGRKLDIILGNSRKNSKKIDPPFSSYAAPPPTSTDCPPRLPSHLRRSAALASAFVCRQKERDRVGHGRWISCQRRPIPIVVVGVGYAEDVDGS
jgi:hypothetical protein